jgi:CRISPR/Cas system-associated exonuclease Cas4 (RecB family)
MADCPNEVALDLTGRNYVSFSAISTYQSCPLRYFFRYVEGLPEDLVSSSLAFGGSIHSAVEHHFNELMAGCPAPDLDTLLSAFWAAWRDRQEVAEIKFGKGEDVNSVGELAQRVLTAFQASDLSRPAGRILGVEEELRGRIVDDVPDLLARIDLLIETDTELAVVDLKTARSRWSEEQASDSGEQLLLYSELARHLAPSKTVVCRFIVITKAKTPAVEQHTVLVDRKRVDRTKAVVERVWRAIEGGVFFPAPSPIACGSCPFSEACRRWPD